MKKILHKPPKVSLCRECGGTGRIRSIGNESVVCPQCEGSGRVTVSGTIEMDIRAYKPESSRAPSAH